MSSTSAGRRALRIGELAALSGTTARAIRHYHAIGLLPEPERDGSGYRRYGADELVRLVRIRRLRGMGMSLAHIASALPVGGPGPADLSQALRTLADDLARQIADLEELRSRVLDLSAADALGAPVRIWGDALRRYGALGEGGTVPAAEHSAVELVDALHPGGIGAVIDSAADPLSDPATVTRIGGLLQRFRSLDPDAEESTTTELALAFAAALPRPDRLPEPVDPDVMDRLTAGRLSPAQRRCTRHLRRLLEQAGPAGDPPPVSSRLAPAWRGDWEVRDDQ